MDRFFTEYERQILQALEGEEIRKAVLKLWVKKEAAIKWERGKLATGISLWECNFDKDIITNKVLNKKLNITFIDTESWYISIATKGERKSTSPIICSQF